MKRRNSLQGKSPTESLDFSTVLAGCIHDVKNSLGILINRIAEVSAALGDGKHKIELEQLQ